MKSTRTQVVLLDASYGLGFQALPALSQTGRYDVIALSLMEEQQFFRSSRQCRHEYLRNWDWQSGPGQLASIASRYPGGILLPLTQDAMTWVTRHQTELGKSWRLPPLNSLPTLQMAADKALFADFVHSIGLESPRSLPLPCGFRPLDTLRYPVLLKPRGGSGGRGIRKFNNRTALAARLLSLTTMDMPHFYLQEWVEGEDFSCGVLCQDGEIRAEVAYCCLEREKEFGAFRTIEAVNNSQLSCITATLMRALRWNGVANIDLRRAPDGRFYVLELNPRLWGNVLGALSWGLNFPDMLCRTALREDISIQRITQGVYFGIPESLALSPQLLTLARAAGVSPLYAYRHSSLPFVLRDPVRYWKMFRARRNKHAQE